METAKDEVNVKELTTKYFRQLTRGCGTNECLNQYCASNRNFTSKSTKEAATEAVRLVKSYEASYLCPTFKKKKLLLKKKLKKKLIILNIIIIMIILQK